MSQNKNGNLTVIDWIRHVMSDGTKTGIRKTHVRSKEQLLPATLLVLSSGACYQIIYMSRMATINRIFRSMAIWKKFTKDTVF
jgi:hypothetical protein